METFFAVAPNSNNRVTGRKISVMEYRRPENQQELDGYIEMVRLAFNTPVEVKRYWQEMDPATQQNSRVLVGNTGELLGGLGILDEGALYFNSPTPISTALITNVASPPEHRRKGYIRHLFQGMFEEQRDAGMVLSALYPFSFSFYRMFGYELANDVAEHRVSVEQFKAWRKAAKRGQFVQVLAEQFLAEDSSEVGVMDKLYREWASRNLMMLERNRRRWLRKLVYRTEPNLVYLYYGEGGTPDGYIIYRLIEKGNWERDLRIVEMCARTEDARDSIRGFIYNHDSQAQQIVFEEPVDIRFGTLLDDPRADQIKIEAGSMLCVLNVVEAFRQRVYSADVRADFAFSLTDEMLPVNSGTYRVSVEDGGAMVAQVPGGEDVGLRLTITVLSQLYAGYMSPMQAARAGLIEVSDENDLRGMDAALMPKGQAAPYMADFF